MRWSWVALELFNLLMPVGKKFHSYLNKTAAKNGRWSTLAKNW